MQNHAFTHLHFSEAMIMFLKNSLVQLRTDTCTISKKIVIKNARR